MNGDSSSKRDLTSNRMIDNRIFGASFRLTHFWFQNARVVYSVTKSTQGLRVRNKLWWSHDAKSQHVGYSVTLTSNSIECICTKRFFDASRWMRRARSTAQCFYVSSDWSLLFRHWLKTTSVLRRKSDERGGIPLLQIGRSFKTFAHKWFYPLVI